MKIDAETLKKQVILHLPYLLLLLVFAKLGEAELPAPASRKAYAKKFPAVPVHFWELPGR